MKSAVFCYASTDATFARRVGEYLELNCGVSTFYDEGRVRPGFDLVAAAERALSAEFAVVVLSPASVPEKWVRERWEPVLVEQPEESGAHIAFLLLAECKYPPVLGRGRSFFDVSQDERGAFRGLKRWIMKHDGARLGAAIELPDDNDGTGLEADRIEYLRRELADQPGLELTLKRDEALAFARECGEDFEGLFFIECAGRSRTGIVGDTAHALGLRLAGPPYENMRALEQFCAARRCLLVFHGLPHESEDAASLGGRCSVIITEGGATYTPPPLAETAALFSSWMRDPEACLRALAAAEAHLNGLEDAGREQWPLLLQTGSGAVSVLKHYDRLAEAYEVLGTIARAHRARGDVTGAYRYIWDQGWISEKWGEARPQRPEISAPFFTEQLTLAL